MWTLQSLGFWLIWLIENIHLPVFAALHNLILEHERICAMQPSEAGMLECAETVCIVDLQSIFLILSMNCAHCE